MKIYLVLTTKLAIANFLAARAEGTPMLNDNLGDRCHMNLDDAVAASIDISESLEEPSERGAAVVHVEYDGSLHEALAYEGHIKGGVENDFFGKPLWTVTAEGARRLNGAASFTMSVHALPLVVKHRLPQSTTLN